MNDDDVLKWEKIQAENKSLHKQNLLLEKALKKSEQQLAETRALLELKKKVALLLGESEGN